jgi:hypothetical protein
MDNEMRIDYLANHPNLISTVAAWYVKMWGKFRDNPSIRQSKNLGFKKIYLYTMDATIHCWYQKLNWEIIKEDVVREHDVKIMETKV